MAVKENEHILLCKFMQAAANNNITLRHPPNGHRSTLLA